jgi:hypothetical protein
VKVNKDALTVDLEEQNDSIEWDELIDELPDAAPRFVAYRSVSAHLFSFQKCLQQCVSQLFCTNTLDSSCARVAL